MQKVSNHLCINTYTAYVLPVRKNDFGSFLKLVTYSYTQVLVSGDPKVSVTLAALVSFFLLFTLQNILCHRAGSPRFLLTLAFELVMVQGPWPRPVAGM